MPRDDKWGNIPKIMHYPLTAKQAETYRLYQDPESKHWAISINQRSFTSTMVGMQTLLSWVLYLENVPGVMILTLFNSFELLMIFWGNITPGKWLVNSFPQLAKLPELDAMVETFFEEDGYRRTTENDHPMIQNWSYYLVCIINSLRSLINLLQMKLARNILQPNSIPV